MIDSGKGASMMKLPLSETTGPALAFAIRSSAVGEPMRWRFYRIFLYAKGTTSMGMPCLNCVRVSISGRSAGHKIRTFVPSTLEFLR